MYCVHCGKELVDESIICPNCGCYIKSTKVKSLVDDNERKVKKEKDSLTKSVDVTIGNSEITTRKKVFGIFLYLSMILLCISIILIFLSIDDVDFSISESKWGTYVYYFWGYYSSRWSCALGWISFVTSIVHFFLSFKEENKSSQNVSVLVLLLCFAIAISASMLC